MNENKIGNYVVCYFWVSIGFLDFTSTVFSFFNAAIFDKNDKQRVLHVTELSNLKFSQFFSCRGLNANSESNCLNDSIKYKLIIYPFAVMRVNLKCVKAQTSIKRSWNNGSIYIDKIICGHTQLENIIILNHTRVPYETKLTLQINFSRFTAYRGQRLKRHEV